MLYQVHRHGATVTINVTTTNSAHHHHHKAPPPPQTPPTTVVIGYDGDQGRNQNIKSPALQEALDEEACLEEQMLSLMHRFADRFTNHRPVINRLNSLPDHPLIEYGHYALGCMTGTDVKKARDELLRSIEEKHQLIKNYKEM
uniref:Uncharacterized protein n=1 Tax=Tanacetum cinerariifolium TaxID=118510 RepID=A0A6L2JTH4_TANCI|nr:hypothetical protein [Tanacetum cinerariifolium]